MANQRKYSEDEVGEIFALATSADRAALPVLSEQEGLTLGELQEVGREVGLTPERVAAAVASLNARSEKLPRRTWLGTPESVGRTVELPRAATDHEWQVLVAELRETFKAKGQVAAHGDLREWTNGNLHAFLEPTETGHRLRLGTHKDAAKALSAIGAVGFVVGLLLLVTSGLDEATFRGILSALIPAVMALVGGGVVAGNSLRLRQWADKREEQMAYIAGRARALIGAPSTEGAPEV